MNANINYLILLMLLNIFLHKYSKKWASDFNWGEAVKNY